MSNNRLNAGISISMPDSIQVAINLVAALSGKDPRELAKLNPNEIMTILAKLIESEKEKVMELLESHDENQQLDAVSLAYLWKLVDKKIVKDKGQKFGSIPNKTFEEIQLHQYKRIRDTIHRTINNLGAATSSYTTSIPKIPLPTSIKVDSLSPIMHRMKHALEVANGNAVGLVRGGRK